MNQLETKRSVGHPIGGQPSRPRRWRHADGRTVLLLEGVLYYRERDHADWQVIGRRRTVADAARLICELGAPFELITGANAYPSRYYPTGLDFRGLAEINGVVLHAGLPEDGAERERRIEHYRHLAEQRLPLVPPHREQEFAA